MSRNPVVGSIIVFVSLAGAVCGLTLLFLGMRGVMDVGGSCGSGGPYVYRQACPGGVAGATMIGIWGGVIFFGVYVWQVLSRGVPHLIELAWPALFLSLGWNFLEYGLNPPGSSGLGIGWLICAVAFGLMGAVPLLVVWGPFSRRFFPFVPRPGPRGQPASARPAVVRSPAVRDEPTRSPEPSRRAEMVRLSGLLSTAGRQAVPVVRSAADGPSQAPSAPSPVVAELERLAALQRSGALTEDEFAAAKRRVLEDDR